MRWLLLVAMAVVLPSVALCAGTGSIRGHILDPSGSALPGAAVILTLPGGEQQFVTSDGAGEYVFANLPPGRCSVTSSLDGFEPSVRGNLLITDGALTVDMTLALATVHQDVTVTAAVAQDVIGTPQPNAPVSVTRAVMDVAMMPNSQFDDVLTLMPNVVRGPDGTISVGGARSTAGGLVVNGIDTRDPILGGAGLMLPLEAVDTLHVYEGGAPAEYGLASGGITAVETRSGSERFHVRLDSFLPRLRFGNEGVEGVAFWDPDFGMSGPIGSGRATFQQAISYRYDRNTFTTLAGPDHNVFNALLSWTQVDTRLTDAQRLRLSFAADPRQTDHANVNAFAPSASTPALTQGGFSTAATYVTAAHGIATELQASMTRNRDDVTPDGSDAYVMSHTLATGSYFDKQHRHAQQTLARVRVSWSPTGHQTVTAGASLGHAFLHEQVEGGGITMLRSDGAVARTITFGPGGSTRVASTSAALFVQDRWTPRSWMTFDVGFRRDATTAAATPAAQPRAGFTLSTSDGRSSFSSNIGLFTDALPLAALAFADLPSRQIAAVDQDGNQAVHTVVNAPAGRLNAPAAVRWDLELDRHVGDWLVRLRYDERRGTHDLVVHSQLSTAVLASDGQSRSRSLEATAGVRSASGNELYVSYVRALALGHQNTLDAVEGVLRLPFVQTDQFGPLPSDVPNRILTWGLFHLPSHITVAPFLDARSGFPFTPIDDAWLVAGGVNSERLPWTASLDLSVTRVTRLPRGLPDARLGLKLYNLAAVHTEREVQRDVTRIDFGDRYDPVPRDVAFVFELLWGSRRRAGT